MTTKYSEERSDEVSRFSVSTNAEITIQIAGREGHQFIVIKEQHPAGTISPTEQTIEIPAALLPELKRAVAVLEENFGDEDEPEPRNQHPISFAHESEEEFAHILDFYNITWQYEPRTFAVEWDDMLPATPEDSWLADQRTVAVVSGKYAWAEGGQIGRASCRERVCNDV